MDTETMNGHLLSARENSPIAHSLSGSVSINKIIKLFRPIEFQKVGQLHFTNLYKPLVNLALEVISFILLIPVLLICSIVLLITGKFEAFALWSPKKERK